MKLLCSVRKIVIVSSICTLTGCGAGGPSISESQQALDKIPGAEMMAMTVKSVEDCQEVRDNVYGCDIEISSEMLGIMQNRTANMKFKKNNDGQWVILN